jgi:hypothetical protein
LFQLSSSAVKHVEIAGVRCDNDPSVHPDGRRQDGYVGDEAPLYVEARNSPGE